MDITATSLTSMAPLAAPLRHTARQVLRQHHRSEGHTVPNAETYPWQWLWDSAFHAIAWSALGEPEPATRELSAALEPQADDGFVPHIRYHGASPHAAFWKRPDTSSITQPPMFGHAIAELVRSGAALPAQLIDNAVAAIRFLLDHRTRIDGLVTVVHPWETGADNSPRWDHWCPGGFDVPRWYDAKGQILDDIVVSPHGSPTGNDRFVAAPAGFNALVAFNAMELAETTDDERLAERASELIDALDSMWEPHLRTWADAGDAHRSSGRVRTLDGLLPLLVSSDEHAASIALDELVDHGGFAAEHGPLGVHRDEPSFEPGSYWRGGTWPQMAYLAWVGALRRGRHDVAEAVAETTIRGARSSGFAEYWDGDTGEPAGAAPQSWTALVTAMEGQQT